MKAGQDGTDIVCGVRRRPLSVVPIRPVSEKHFYTLYIVGVRIQADDGKDGVSNAVQGGAMGVVFWRSLFRRISTFQDMVFRTGAINVGQKVGDGGKVRIKGSSTFISKKD